MVRLAFLKGKAKEERRGFAPIERVRELLARGFSEVEIIDILRKEGFLPDEIDLALTEVLRGRIAEEKREEAPRLPTIEEIAPEKEVKLEVPETPLPEKYYEETYPSEEYIDAIIQSRVSELNLKMSEFAARYEELSKRVEAINSLLQTVLEEREKLNESIESRVDELKESINELNIKISGLEKAFKDTLPALIESVRSLSDLVQYLRKEI